MDSHTAEARVAEGLAFEKQGQAAESIRCYREAMQAQPTAQAHWRVIDALMRSEQLDQAYKECKAALTLYPQEPLLHVLFARLKEKLGSLDMAREVLCLAAEKFPDNTDILVEYAVALFRTKQFAESIPVLERVIALEPSAAIYRALAKMKRNAGDKAGAQRAIREGLERFPLDVPLARNCTNQAVAARAQDVMRAAVPTLEDAGQRSEILRYLTEKQAAKNRSAARLAPEPTSWADLVRWADPDGMAAFASSLERELSGPGPRAQALGERAMAAVAQADWSGAERWFAQARQQPTYSMADVTTFDPDFFARLERASDEDIWSPFPPTCEVVGRSIWPAAMIYVSCDPKYFELFMPRFLESLVEAGSEAGVHVHLLDGTEHDWSRLAQSLRRHERVSASMTAEGGARRNFLGSAARYYYHAARYVRFYQYIRRNMRPAWLMDVDLVAETDPTPMFELLESHDFAATSRAGVLEPWGRIQAGLVGVAPTIGGLRYLRLVAAYISNWYRKGNLQWGIDQLALFAAYAYLAQRGHAPDTRFLGEEFMNDRDGLPCIIRPVMDADSRWEKNQ